MTEYFYSATFEIYRPYAYKSGTVLEGFTSGVHKSEKQTSEETFKEIEVKVRENLGKGCHSPKITGFKRV